jgi:hypothetical protein
MLQTVTVQLTTGITVKSIAHLAQILVKNVIWTVTVLFVKPIEKVSQTVLVLIIILKPKSKELFSVKFVMSDVENVTTFSIYVRIVPMILEESTLLNVTVL